jgi:hypothetical protein
MMLAGLCAVSGQTRMQQVRRHENPQKSEAGTPASTYAQKVHAQRRARDEEFRSRRWSALAVVAIARLDRPRITIGSGSGVDLALIGDGVAGVHAEILRQQGTDNEIRWKLRALEGKVWTDSEPPKPVYEMSLEAGARVRIGHFIVYNDNLGTLGSVVRALDFTSPAFTQFKGLVYYPPDPRYRIEATVVPHARMAPVLIGDTHGWQRPAWRYGDARFTLEGKELQLTLMVFTPKPGPKDTFFIAFTDETKGKETYPAARYLQPLFVPAGPMVLDFNEAMNPSCAYNDGFACPLPPPENRLPIAIRAGEKIYPNKSEHR